MEATLSGSPLAPGAARALLRKTLTEWAGLPVPGAGRLTGRVGDDATLVASELVTNAVVHAGTDVRLICRLEEDTGALVVEVADHHPSRAPRGDEPEVPPAHATSEFGRGLRLVAALSESWGITYRPGTKTVWARLSPGERAAGEQTEAHASAHDLRVPETPTPDSRGTRGPADTRAARGPGGQDGGRVSEGSDSVRGSTALPADEDPSEQHAVRGSEGPHAVRGSEGSHAVRGSEGPHASGEPDGPHAVRGSADLGASASWDPSEPRAVRGSEGPHASGEPDGPHAAQGSAGPHAPGGSSEPHVARGFAEAFVARDVQDVRGPRDVEGLREPVLVGGRDAWRGGSYGDDWLARRHGRDGTWLGRGALSFLAEASDLLAGQLDEDLVASLTGQLIVPRLADWCAVWLEDEATGHAGWRAGGPRLARVWHASENRIEGLSRALEQRPPHPGDPLRSGPVPYPWPGAALDGPDDDAPGTPPDGGAGTALAYRLVAGGRPLGTLVIGRGGIDRFPDEITGLVEDLGRRVALAIGAARQYARQATISAVLQRGLLPGAVAEIPGVRSALVYEPCDKGGPSGDFYDLFPAGQGRWCFAVGDVQGKGPEAAVVIGLARPWLRLLAREGYRVADVLDRLNQLLLDDATEAADAAARALVAAGARPTAPGDGPQTRFLSLLYGELVPFPGGVRCTLASAGHPLPLLLDPDGGVRPVAQPQTLLGVVEDAAYTSETFEMYSGDTLLCVTDGVTERRSGSRQFDDGDGLATALAGCAGMEAELIAERITQLVHEFGARPPADDLALLVLQAE
ncbi:protein phosphatase [Streptomyces sp. WAC 01420]|nr:protein phosphatase [Streptomyces sp. WAC 01438]RSM93656.1 protein phosphatase [Streptomyces sp. WAC 01420]